MQLQSRQLCVDTLGELIKSSGKHCWQLRMDVDVNVLVGDGHCAFVSSGIEVEIPIHDGTTVDVSAWVAACNGPSACKSAKLIIGKMQVEDGMKAVVNVCESV